MLIFFGVLLLITAVILGMIILIQNPKGGGVSGVLGGFSNQLMGVKQSTDVMEKGTWIFAAVFAVLCILSSAFISKTASSSSVNDDLLKGTKAAPAQQVTPKPAAPAAPATPAP